MSISMSQALRPDNAKPEKTAENKNVQQNPNPNADLDLGRFGDLQTMKDAYAPALDGRGPTSGGFELGPDNYRGKIIQKEGRQYNNLSEQLQKLFEKLKMPDLPSKEK